MPEFGRVPGVLATVWRVMGERRLAMIAASVGFYTMLALFPGLAALIALIGIWSDPLVVQDTLELVREFIPDEAFTILSDQITRLIGNGAGNLGWASVISLGAAFWSSRLGVGALADGLGAIYGCPPRGGIWDILLALALTAVLIGVGVVAVAAILLMPVVIAIIGYFVPQNDALLWTAELLRWAVALGAVVIGLSLFYRYGPNRTDGRRTPFLSQGLLLAIALWAVASAGFTIFLANFGNYNEVYGSIGAVIALLMWFYISAYAVLLGGALNYAVELQPTPEQAAADQDKPDQPRAG